jgi:exopolysaccharide biosynthesis protein
MTRSIATRLTILTLFLAPTLFADDWQNIAPGVDFREFNDETRDIYVARIDLSNDAIRIVSTRPSEKGIKVSEFAKKNKAIVAINGDYFDDKFQPIGLVVGPCGQWEGTKDTSREAVLAFGDDRAEIQRQSEVMDPPDDWVDTAVSGWPALVVGCDPIEKLPGSDAFTRSPHPRTAVGLSRDRKTMYFVVAEGRHTGVVGLTLPQLADFMANRLHACTAINLDGGGSSAMWVSTRIVNRPSDGVERPVGDHLAVVLRSDYAGCDNDEAKVAAKNTASPMASSSTIITTTTKTTTTTTTTSTAPPPPKP